VVDCGTSSLEALAKLFLDRRLAKNLRDKIRGSDAANNQGRDLQIAVFHEALLTDFCRVATIRSCNTKRKEIFPFIPVGRTHLHTAR
jgi:hypothetical protein